MRRAAAVLPLLLAAGCSVVFVKGPPDPHEPSVEPHCTTSRVVPVLDVLGSAALGVGSAVAFSGAEGPGPSFGPDMSERNAEQHRPWAIGMLVGSLALLSSGVVGMSRTSRCDEAHELHEAFKTY